MSQGLPVPAGWYALMPVARLEAGVFRELEFCGLTVLVGRSRGGAVSARSQGELEVLERAGMLFGWYHPEGAPSGFQLREVADPGWSPWSFQLQELAIHPLHVMRDLADLRHFETVHLYDNIHVREPLRAEGPRLHTRIDFGWDTGLPRVKATLPSSFVARVEGPGYQLTEVSTSPGLVGTRHLVLPSPAAEGRCRLFLGHSVRTAGALRPLRRLVHRAIGRAYVRDVGRDAQLWLSLPHAPLPTPDEHFRVFGDWAQQFMPAR
jgi:hypothetical protein